MIHRLARPLLFFLLCISGPAMADDILPVAKGRFTVMFVKESHTAPLKAGAWVDFIGTAMKDVPTRLRLEEAFVLGTRGDVVFVEVTEKAAVVLAHRRVSQKVRLRKTRDPDLELVAARREASDMKQAVTLAPSLSTVSVTVPVEESRIEAWKRGIGLTFTDAREVKRISYRDERTRSRFYDIGVQFVSAKRLGTDRYELTVIADPADALALLRAEANGRLATIVAGGEPKLKPVEETRCYVTTRHGSKLMRIEIPCT